MPRRPLISERDIARAVRAGVSALEVGDAVVTPSARDAANKAGIALRAGAGAAAGDPARRDAGNRDGGKARALRVAIGADHGGVALKETIAARLRELGHEVTDLGTTGTAAVDYPDFAVAVARAVAGKRADFGIMVDGAGIGSCMAANKVPGVRAANCHDVTTATNAREHNDATVLTLGGGLLGPRLALAVVETFLSTAFAGGRHAPRVAKIDALNHLTHPPPPTFHPPSTTK